MNIERDRIFQLFKYSVYALLTLNVYLFCAEEWAASGHRFADGIAFSDIIEGYAASLDTAAWVDVINAGVGTHSCDSWHSFSLN